MRINDEEEKPDDYAEDVMVAVVEIRCKSTFEFDRVYHVPGNCDTRRVKVTQKRWTHMVERNVYCLLGAPTDLTRETHSQHQGLHCFFAPSLPSKES